MDKYKQFVDTLRSLAPEPPIPLFPAQVNSIEGDTCTVQYGDLEITDVRLKATIGSTGNELLMIPKVGCTVLLGSLTGDLKDLAVLRIDELETITYSQDGLLISIDATDGSVSIANSQTSLKDLFQQLVNLLEGFQVLTGTGPSAGLMPDTLTAIQQFETNFKMLLK